MIIGENINIGLGAETTRGTAVAPSIWLPGRSPAGIRPVVDKVLIRETRGGKVGSAASELSQIRAEGELEFNIKVNSIGHILKSLFGKVTTTSLGSGAYSHLFEILLTTPQHPTFTVALAKSATGYQHYKYAGAMANSLELRAPLGDVANATVGLIARAETTNANYTPAFTTNDYMFRQYDISMKLATNLAGLGAASVTKVKELGLTVNNNARPDQNLGELNASDIIATLFEIGGSFSADYNDEAQHDIYVGGLYRAMRIAMTRTDITIGAAQNPSITIDMGKVSFENLEQDRPIDDVVRDGIEFTAHYSDADAKAITVTVVNETASY